MYAVLQGLAIELYVDSEGKRKFEADSEGKRKFEADSKVFSAYVT